jgi:hypothetical protein
MPRFYFHLKSKQTRIPDDKGKNLDTLNEAYEHGRKLIDKILQHVGYLVSSPRCTVFDCSR